MPRPGDSLPRELPRESPASGCREKAGAARASRPPTPRLPPRAAKRGAAASARVESARRGGWGRRGAPRSAPRRPRQRAERRGVWRLRRHLPQHNAAPQPDPHLRRRLGASWPGRSTPNPTPDFQGKVRVSPGTAPEQSCGCCVQRTQVKGAVRGHPALGKHSVTPVLVIRIGCTANFQHINLEKTGTAPWSF